MSKDEIKDVKGTTDKCTTIAKPSYDDLEIENERLEKSRRRLQRLVFALERSLGAQVDEIFELEQDRDYYKQQYHKEHKRAENLFEKLNALERDDE